MNLITLGTDRLLFDSTSKVSQRIEEQAALFSSHTVLVFTKRSQGYRAHVVGNLRIIPTNSFAKILYGFDAIRIGRRVGKGATLVSAQDPFETGLSALILSRLLCIPLHVQVHTDFLSPYFGVTLFNRVRQLLARIVVPRASCIRVVSKRIADSIVARFGPRAITILPVFEPFAGEDVAGTGTFGFKKFFLVASRLEPEKDVAVALRAFADVSVRHPGIGLVVAGSGSERTRLEALARTLAIEDAVLFLGWRSDIPALLRSACAFVSTSLYEGYGVSLLMAARAGCPIITTDVGLIGSDIPQEMVDIVRVGEAEDVSLAMEHALSDTGNLQDRATYVRDTVRASAMGREEYLQKVRGMFEGCVVK